MSCKKLQGHWWNIWLRQWLTELLVSDIIPSWATASNKDLFEPGSLPFVKICTLIFPHHAVYARPPLCFHEAPAKILAEHQKALDKELNLRGRPELSFNLSTKGLGSQPKNAARTFKRAIKRFRLALKLAWIRYVNFMLVVPRKKRNSYGMTMNNVILYGLWESSSVGWGKFSAP